MTFTWSNICSRFKDKINEIWWQLYKCTLALKSCTLSKVLHTKSNLICWILKFKHVIYPLYLSKPSVIPLSYCVNFLSDNSSLTSFCYGRNIFLYVLNIEKHFSYKHCYLRCKSMMFQPKKSVLTHGCICWLCHVIFYFMQIFQVQGIYSVKGRWCEGGPKLKTYFQIWLFTVLKIFSIQGILERTRNIEYYWFKCKILYLGLWIRFILHV